MNRKWLTGTAMAAVLAATPAMAQDATTEFGECALDKMNNETFLGFDMDDDSGLTADEYRACLDEKGVELDADGMAAYDAAYTEADADADGVLVFAEVETYMVKVAETDTTTGAATATQVDVKQAAPDVTVAQESPTVQVEQANPTVEVEQAEPQVAVTQEKPEVQVSQPKPEVSVTQPEAQVAVTQPEAQVAVQQPEAKVEVDAPAPDVEVTQAQPQVSVEQKEPEVRVEQAEPQVNVETAQANVAVQSEEPKVVIEQGEPEVVVEKVTEVEETDVAMAETDAAPKAMDEDTADVKTVVATDEASLGVSFDELEGETAYNNNGEEIGSVDEVVREKATGNMFLVVSVGGILGIGDTDIVFPMSDVSMNGDKVMVSTPLTEETLEEQAEYDEDMFEEMTD